MFAIKPMPQPVDANLLDILSKADPSDIGHLRYWGMMRADIRRVSGTGRIAGTAVTVIAPSIDSSIIPHVLGIVRPGDILVIDRVGDNRHACLGGVVALAAKIAGVAGIIIDGLANDFAELQENGLSVWCTGQSAFMSKLLGIAGAINVPVCCGGVAVVPGDAILADETGICVLPPDDIERMVAGASAAAARRPARLERIVAGEKLGAVNGISARIEKAIAAPNA